MRCPWGDDPAMIAYHDTEWGKELRGDRELFERMSLEAFQSGLSWAIILRKRDGFREAFAGFDPEAVAAFGDADIDRLLEDAGIVRNRMKIEATISNARTLLELDESFSDLLWSFAPPPRPAPDVLRRGAGHDARVDRDGQGAQEEGFSVLRPDHGIRADAGHRHGQRPPRGLRRPRDPPQRSTEHDANCRRGSRKLRP